MENTDLPSASSTSKLFKIKKNYQETIWRKEEDELLVEILSQKKQNKWALLLKKLQGKTQKECISRFNVISDKYKKGRWTQEEDEKLMDLINNFGKNWRLIAKILKNRSNKQIRTRFSDHLDKNVNKKKFSEEEDRKIIELYGELSNKFQAAVYKRNFENRTSKDLKNRLDFLIRNNRLNPISEECENNDNINNNNENNKLISESASEERIRFDSYRNTDMNKKVYNSIDNELTKFSKNDNIDYYSKADFLNKNLDNSFTIISETSSNSINSLEPESDEMFIV